MRVKTRGTPAKRLEEAEKKQISGRILIWYLGSLTSLHIKSTYFGWPLKRKVFHHSLRRRWCITSRSTKYVTAFICIFLYRLTRAETSIIHLNLVLALAVAQIVFLTGIEATQNKVISTCYILKHFLFTRVPMLSFSNLPAVLNSVTLAQLLCTILAINPSFFQ